MFDMLSRLLTFELNSGTPFHYQSERLRIMTSKTLLAGLLTTLVFLILIEFSNSNPSGIRQVSSDGKENGLLELESKVKIIFLNKLDTLEHTFTLLKCINIHLEG